MPIMILKDVDDFLPRHRRPNDWGDPTHDQLYQALAKARTRGAGNPDKPLRELEPLRRAARWISDKEDDESRIEDALTSAANELGGMGAKAVLLLLGLTPETRHREVEVRRALAAEAYDYKDAKTFRVHYEKQLLLTTAMHLLIEGQKGFIEDQRTLLLHEREKLQDDRCALVLQWQDFIEREERLKEAEGKERQTNANSPQTS
jgi:hypothetical protein